MSNTRKKGLTSASYATTQPTKRHRRAAGFRADPGLEQVLDLQDADPRAYAALGRDLRLAAAYYANAK